LNHFVIYQDTLNLTQHTKNYIKENINGNDEPRGWYDGTKSYAK